MERIKGIIHTKEKWLKPGVIFNEWETEINLNDLGSFTPKPHQIARALSRIHRYRGVTAYTVAQHCVRGADAFLIMGDADKALQFLWHDAVEYVVGDIPGPVIKMFPEIDDLQNEILDRLSKAIGFRFPFHQDVHTMDKNLAEIEMSTYISDPEAYQSSIWTQDEAFRRFIEMEKTIHRLSSLTMQTA